MAVYKQKGGGILYYSDILRVRPGDLLQSMEINGNLINVPASSWQSKCLF